MLVTITSKRQVTLSALVLDALGVKPGDRVELQLTPEGCLLRAKRVDASRLAPLRGKLSRTAPAFDIHAFREQPHGRKPKDRFQAVRGDADVRWRTDRLMKLLRGDD